MKNIVVLVIALIVAYLVYVSLKESEPREQITVSGAWALYPLMVKWAEEYHKIDSAIVIDITGGGAGKGMTDALARMTDLGMVSREIYTEEIDKGAWFVGVAEDAVVPTFCDDNPYRDIIRKHGVTADSLRDLFITGDIISWKALLPAAGAEAIQVYTRGDPCGAKETFAAFLSSKQDDFKGVGVQGDPGLAAEVARNKFAAGYNNIGYFFDPNTKKPHPHLAALPIDLNGNGIIDPEENFYDHMDSMIAAIMDGRYPRPPTRELYVVSQGRPAKPAVRRFLKWILTDGQHEARRTGYIPLSAQRTAELLKTLED